MTRPMNRMGKRAFVKRLVTACSVAAASPLLPTQRAADAAQPKAAASATSRERRVLVSDAGTVLEISSGKIRGCERSGIFVYKGIPYGESTGGENRFMPPQPVKPWPGVRDALLYGRACIQPSSDSAHYNFDARNAPGSQMSFLMHGGESAQNPGEDCLRVNVWTPSTPSSSDTRRRPVMVFMHGGGFEGGSDHDLGSYDGENLARNDVVVVTHNHRLNIFGYLNLSGLAGGKYPANVGLLDLVALLQWVHDNIAEFGGDPGNVTVFGQSGGGGKIICLMAMPAAKGLFHRAIVQSGPYLRVQTPEDSAANTAEVLRQLGLTANDVDRLQQMPVDRLVGAAAEAMKKLVAPRPVFRRIYGVQGWQPFVDGTVLPRQPFDPVAATESAHVPLLTGSVFNEITSALEDPIGNAMSEAQLQHGVREAYGENGAAIIAAYRRDYPHATPFGIYAAIAAEPFRRAAQEQAARKAVLGGANSYVYLYAWRTPMLDDRPGTFHASDLAFTFDNAERCDHYSGLRPEAMAMAKKVSDAWVAFARTGNPNHPGLPLWPAYTREQDATLIFDNRCEVRRSLERAGLALIAAS